MTRTPDGRREPLDGGSGEHEERRDGGPVSLASVIAEVFEDFDRRAQPAWREAPPRRWIDEEVDLPPPPAHPQIG